MAGRRSIDETNKIRAGLGLSVIPKKKPPVKLKPAILPESKKAKAQEVLAVMLQSKGRKVVHKILNKALDDNDDDQMACLKLVMDRILPADYLTKTKGRNGAIQINITGVGQTQVTGSPDVEEEWIEAEYTEEEYDNEEEVEEDSKDE